MSTLLPLHRMLYTDIRTMDIKTYQDQTLVPRSRTPKEIGASIGRIVHELHEVQPRQFEVVLFFRTNNFALEVMEAAREHWDHHRARGHDLPSLKVTIARNYTERTDHIHINFNEPSQEEV